MMHPPTLIAVAAMAENRVIGMNGSIPWHLPDDFRWFKQLTTGGFVIMGRKTFASLPHPLPNRTNIVLTRHPRKLVEEKIFTMETPPLIGPAWVPRIARGPYQMGFQAVDAREVWVVASLKRLVAAFEREKPTRKVFVIGGAEIYARLLPACGEIFLTHVKRTVEGDTFFPEFESEFDAVETVLTHLEFEVVRYRRRLVACEA